MYSSLVCHLLLTRPEQLDPQRTFALAFAEHPFAEIANAEL